MRLAPLAIALVVSACGQRDSTDERPAATRADADPRSAAPVAAACEPASFAADLPLAEASGATWLELDGAPAILVVGDSGTRGAYALVDPDTGAVRERGQLPLGEGASDDLEGMTAMDGRIYGLTSAGWVRTWERRAGGFALIDGPYPVAAVDETLRRRSDHGADTASLACAGRGVNCGKNYEGICLVPRAPSDPGACAGFAASRADGHLWCLVRQGARLAVDGTRSIAVARRLTLTGCDFAPDGETLWVGTNMLDAARVYRINAWRTPASAQVEPVASLGSGFPEALAIGPAGMVFRFSDTGSPTSAQGRYQCRDPRSLPKRL